MHLSRRMWISVNLASLWVNHISSWWTMMSLLVSRSRGLSNQLATSKSLLSMHCTHECGESTSLAPTLAALHRIESLSFSVDNLVRIIPYVISWQDREYILLVWYHAHLNVETPWMQSGMSSMLANCHHFLMVHYAKLIWFKTFFMPYPRPSPKEIVCGQSKDKLIFRIFSKDVRGGTGGFLMMDW